MSHESKRPVPVNKQAYYQGSGKVEEVEEPTVPADVVPMPPTPPVSSAPIAPPPTPRLLETDKLLLDLAKANRRTALANAQKALSDNEVAELNYKYLVLQLYMKYGLTDADAISEDGQIVMGGALQYKQQVR